MVVKLGTMDLNNVLSWEEENVITIPIKKPVRKLAPTTQSDYFTRTPKRIIITTRLTPAEKTQLRNLKNEHCWQPLCDFHATGVCNEANSDFIDYVWIEKITHDWRGDVDTTHRWLGTINLICSQT